MTKFNFPNAFSLYSRLSLGGGRGWLTGEHGLVIDNIAEATVVTSAGDILKVSETENADLFWAIRGGGGNFGVVTEFVLCLHPQRDTVFSHCESASGLISSSIILTEYFSLCIPAKLSTPACRRNQLVDEI